MQLLARTILLTQYPTTAQALYAVQVVGTPQRMLAYNAGSVIPPLGAHVMLSRIGDRWAFRYDGHMAACSAPQDDRGLGTAVFRRANRRPSRLGRITSFELTTRYGPVLPPPLFIAPYEPPSCTIHWVGRLPDYFARGVIGSLVLDFRQPHRGFDRLELPHAKLDAFESFCDVMSGISHSATFLALESPLIQQAPAKRPLPCGFKELPPAPAAPEPISLPALAALLAREAVRFPR
jgi:hypothetical protein